MNLEQRRVTTSFQTRIRVHKLHAYTPTFTSAHARTHTQRSICSRTFACTIHPHMYMLMVQRIHEGSKKVIQPGKHLRELKAKEIKHHKNAAKKSKKRAAAAATAAAVTGEWEDDTEGGNATAKVNEIKKELNAKMEELYALDYEVCAHPTSFYKQTWFQRERGIQSVTMLNTLNYAYCCG